MSAAATTKGLPRCSSIQSSSGMPMTAAGMQATMVFPHSAQVWRFSKPDLLGEKGLSWRKKMTQTAKMAPS